jgi:hypothetical protein
MAKILLSNFVTLINNFLSFLEENGVHLIVRHLLKGNTIAKVSETFYQKKSAGPGNVDAVHC